MNIPGFEQDLRTFLSSKTNQTAVISVVGIGLSWYLGEVSASFAVPLILGSVFAVTIKDAVAKT